MQRLFFRKAILQILSMLLIWTCVCVTWAPRAHAIDKRLKLMFKTAGYGAAAGAIVGAGTMALGMGGYRNILMGASSGMYAGILLAAYVASMPYLIDEPKRGPRNPYAPRKPVGPDDWEYENMNEDEIRRYLPPQSRLEETPRGPNLEWPSYRSLYSYENTEVSIWSPLVSINF